MYNNNNLKQQLFRFFERGCILVICWRGRCCWTLSARPVPVLYCLHTPTTCIRAYFSWEINSSTFIPTPLLNVMCLTPRRLSCVTLTIWVQCGHKKLVSNHEFEILFFIFFCYYVHVRLVHLTRRWGTYQVDNMKADFYVVCWVKVDQLSSFVDAIKRLLYFYCYTCISFDEDHRHFTPICVSTQKLTTCQDIFMLVINCSNIDYIPLLRVLLLKTCNTYHYWSIKRNCWNTRCNVRIMRTYW